MDPKSLFGIIVPSRVSLINRRVYIISLVIKHRVHIGHRIMTSQYPVHFLTYAAFILFSAFIFYHTTSHVVFANQKQKILEAFYNMNCLLALDVLPANENENVYSEGL